MSQMRHRAGIQADDLVLHTTQAALPIGHQPRHERAVTIPRGRSSLTGPTSVSTLLCYWSRYGSSPTLAQLTIAYPDRINPYL